MKTKQINFLLIALVILNILDEDLMHPSILDIIKFILLIACFYLNNRKNSESCNNAIVHDVTFKMILSHETRAVEYAK